MKILHLKKFNPYGNDSDQFYIISETTANNIENMSLEEKQSWLNQVFLVNDFEWDIERIIDTDNLQLL